MANTTNLCGVKSTIKNNNVNKSNNNSKKSTAKSSSSNKASSKTSSCGSYKNYSTPSTTKAENVTVETGPSTSKTENVKIDSSTIDYGRISSSADGVKNEQFVNVNKSVWDNGNLTYKVRDDNTVLIKNNGISIGYTDLKGIKTTVSNPITTNSNSSYEAKYGKRTPLKGYNDSKTDNSSSSNSNSSYEVKYGERTPLKGYNDSKTDNSSLSNSNSSYEAKYGKRTPLKGYNDSKTDNSSLSNSNSSYEAKYGKRTPLKGYSTEIPDSRIAAVFKDLQLSMPNYAMSNQPKMVFRDLIGDNDKLQYGDFLNIYSNGDITYNINGKEVKLDILASDLVSGNIKFDKIVDIKKNAGFYDIKFKDGSSLTVFDGDNNLAIGYGKDGSLNYGFYVDSENNVQPIGIFSDYSNSNRQFGERQSNFKNNSAELLKDPLILEELEKQFPGTSLSQKQSYLNYIADRCCGFVGKVNGLYEQYEGKEKEFKDTFGFDMYKVDSDGNVDYNGEYMVLKFFDYIYAEKGNKNMNQIKNMTTGHTLAESKKFETFLKDKYDVDCEVNGYKSSSYSNETQYDTVTGASAGTISYMYSKNDILSVYDQLVKEGHDDIMIGATRYDLTDYDNGSKYVSYGSHAMSVVGKEGDDLIVSSFGRKYKLNLDFLKKGCFYTTDYGED